MQITYFLYILSGDISMTCDVQMYTWALKIIGLIYKVFKKKI